MAAHGCLLNPLEINIPSYASVIVTASEVIERLGSEA
jgi:hypothetical protein